MDIRRVNVTMGSQLFILLHRIYTSEAVSERGDKCGKARLIGSDSLCVPRDVFASVVAHENMKSGAARSRGGGLGLGSSKTTPKRSAINRITEEGNEASGLLPVYTSLTRS
eukprot:552462-Prymnesium_polylepis.1